MSTPPIDPSEAIDPVAAAAQWLLVGGLAFGLIPLVTISFQPNSFSFLPPNTFAVLLSLILAVAIGSVMLSGVALRPPTATPVSTDLEASQLAWRATTRFCLAAAMIIGVAAFALLAYVAQFIVGFYLHLVY
jgi:hypothetical protein